MLKINRRTARTDGGLIFNLRLALLQQHSQRSFKDELIDKKRLYVVRAAKLFLRPAESEVCSLIVRETKPTQVSRPRCFGIIRR